ncbi:head GIN domain-containing protein [uncultured Psychroserpens sp.]|uniref:head GIN domain-containing protein n=1 Tax=uncultured Psychroserpens sp. TaxID=255436 RepID=UPI00261AC045|nr:head GIN domain-containing protein [uncultured Psychroserpens sp.]
MTTLTKFTIAVIFSLLLTSCNFDINFDTGVRGNGNVSTVERTLDGDFDQIAVSRGLDVYLTQSDTPMLKVQADENLHDIIITEIDEGVLKIYADKNISRSEAKKVMVNVKDINLITSTSGSDVYSTNTIIADNLKLVTTSGADLEIDIDAESTTLRATSGSDLKVSGTTNDLNAEATSGSDIKARELKAQNCTASVTSGADIIVNAEQKLKANASSGGDIKYYGNPTNVDTNDGVSGSIRKQ